MWLIAHVGGDKGHEVVIAADLDEVRSTGSGVSKKERARLKLFKHSTGVAVSRQDVTIRRWAARENKIVQWTELERGGHFAALEVPELLVADMRAFFRSLR